MCRQCKCCEQSRDRRCVVGACSCCTKASAGAGDSEPSIDMSADSTQATRDNPAMVQLARLSWTLSTGQVRSASAASAWLQVRRRPKRPKAKVRNTICRCHRQRRSTQAPRTATTPSWLQATTRPRAGHPCPAVPVPLPFTRFPGPLVPCRESRWPPERENARTWFGPSFLQKTKFENAQRQGLVLEIGA